MTRCPVNLLPAYHAHVYFGPHTVRQAEALAAQAGALFGVAVGRLHCRPVGPHPHWSCQIAFGSEQFDAVVPWLDAHCGELDVLVHGLSGDDLADHTDHAWWLGREWPLSLEMFEQRMEPDR